MPLTEPGRQGPRFELSWRSAPRYALDRIRVRAARRHQVGEQPWITQDAIDVLSTMLRPTDVGLEFGAGGSTMWLARRTAHVTSIEPHPQWYGPLSERILAAGLRDKVSLHLVSADELGLGSDEHRAAYINACPELAPSSLDFVLVDGGYRDEQALRATTLLAVGGLLIVDNVNTYLPSAARSPWKLSGPATRAWAEFHSLVATWRHIWTTNGVWDTAIWIKP